MIFPDLSEFQTTAEIAAIRKLTPAIILRVAYGASHPDKVFAQYRTEAHTAGYSFVGLYQYLVAGQDAAAQAEAFCKLVGKLLPGEIPILDLEEGSGEQLIRANAWFAVVDAYFGLDKLMLDRRSWIYSNPSFVKTAGLTMLFASARHSWIAAYAQTPPAQPPHTLWQSTDGKVGANRTNWPGCGYIDTNDYTGTIGELAAMAWHPEVVIPQEEEMLNVQVSAKSFVPFPAGSFKQVMVYADFVSDKLPTSVRLAIHSASKGYTVHEMTLSTAAPMSVSFPQTDVNAVSIEIQKGSAVGVTFS